MSIIQSDKLEKVLLSRGLIKPEKFSEAVNFSQIDNQPLEHVLVARGFVSEPELYSAIADQSNITFVDLSNYIIDPNVLNILSPETARKYHVVPLFKIGSKLTVTMLDPTDVAALDQISIETNCDIEACLSGENDITKALDLYYGIAGVEGFIKKLDEDMARFSVKARERDLVIGAKYELEAEETPVIKLLNLIVVQAVRDGASDIHVEPEKDTLRIRFRIDGVLHEIPAPPKYLESAIISRVKVLSELDISENRAPQDGRFRMRVENRDVDVRVSVIPTIHGENVVMRLLDPSSVLIGLEELGFSEHDIKVFESLIKRPYGMILVTGPTGSGKTTTLYAALSTINSMDKNIITIEDPIEYRMNVIRQIQVNPKVGLNFANGLRSILRQDPDVVMVGEVRDKETAEIAIQSALTGHLVFSTLHTNDAPGALTRLVDMGVEPFMISSSVIGVVAQRLVRRICPRCKEVHILPKKIATSIGIAKGGEVTVWRGKGCKNCRQTGYKGRIAVAEMMDMGEELREAVIAKKQVSEIRKIAEKNGMVSLKRDGIEKALAGITTIEEVMRVTEISADIEKIEKEEKAAVKEAAEKIAVKEKEEKAAAAAETPLDLTEYQKKIAKWIANK